VKAVWLEQNGQDSPSISPAPWHIEQSDAFVMEDGQDWCPLIFGQTSPSFKVSVPPHEEHSLI